MLLSLTNFATTLSPTLLHKGGKCLVRECDETSKGVFEAYVDEGNKSYDVSLHLSAKKEITEHHCDCGNTESFCRHRAALLLHLAGKGKTPATTKTAKGPKAKLTKTDLLLESADPDGLKAWVKELLDRNKDLALSFTQRFGEQKLTFTKAEAEALTTEAIKSVVKNRTRIEQSELKKIVETWQVVHKPVVAAYLANVADENSFIAFHSVLESCIAFGGKILATGVKISNYVQSLLDSSLEPLLQLYSEEAFATATNFYHREIVEGPNGVRLHYLLHLQKLFSLSTPGRFAVGLKKLVQQYSTSQPEKRFNGSVYTKTLFSFVEANGFLPRYLTVFKPIRYDNDFNSLLIEKLIKSSALELAENFAKDQIAGNSREEFNRPYLELLKKIYMLQNNEEALSDVIAQLLPFTFNFDDYLFFYNRMPEGEEKKKWRTRLLSKAKNAGSYGRGSAQLFHFRLLAYEKSYKKMIDSIDSATPYSLILTYLGPMAATDSTKLLKVILDKYDKDVWNLSVTEKDAEEETFPLLQQALEKLYGTQTLVAALKNQRNNRYMHKNRLVSYLTMKLIKT